MTRRMLLWGALAMIPTAVVAQGDGDRAQHPDQVTTLPIVAVRWSATPVIRRASRRPMKAGSPGRIFLAANVIGPVGDSGVRGSLLDAVPERPDHPNTFGFNHTADHPVPHRVSAYFGAGYDRVQPAFHLNYTNSMGDRDRRRVIVDLDQVVMFGGGTWQPHPRLSTSGEVYVSPEDAMTVRLLVRQTF